MHYFEKNVKLTLEIKKKKEEWRAKVSERINHRAVLESKFIPAQVQTEGAVCSTAILKE